MNRTDNKKVMRSFLNIGLVIIAVGYLYMLLKIVLFKYGFTTDVRSLNMIPFRFLQMFRDGTALDVALKNILGNIAIFIPLGIYVSLLSKNHYIRSGIICAFVSLGFEIIQLITGCGATDIDDLILNTLGGILGVLIYAGLLKRPDQKLKLPVTTILFLMVFGIGGRMALYLFAPNMLPVDIVYENQEVFEGVDKDSYNLSAVYTQIKDGYIYLRENSADADSSELEQSPQNQYMLSEDAILIIERKSFQYSPNGNIQKIFVSYDRVDEKSATQLMEEAGDGFIDLWIDGENNCSMLVFTVIEN
ncbi:MAG: VanZ family protein [Lachnospiraceae bacterium]|nr:VanZ family protein [Lachnospiraceae bacterium]